MSKVYPCVYCTEDGYCQKYSDEKVKSWCVQSPCEDERPSNADRIRSMSDEELAELLTTVAQNSANKLCESLKTIDVDLSNCDFGILYKTHLDWLKRSVEKGEI
jgi:hypothetical protein